MKKFEIVKRTAEVKKANRLQIKEGVASFDEYPETVAIFATLDDAKKTFANYATEIDELQDFYIVTEFSLEENDYDADGEFLEAVCVWDLTVPVVKVVNEDDEVIAEFSNFADAEDFYANAKDAYEVRV